jgi:hypothetical protein
MYLRITYSISIYFIAQHKLCRCVSADISEKILFVLHFRSWHNKPMNIYLTAILIGTGGSAKTTTLLS